MSNAEKVERLRARAAELHAKGQLDEAAQCCQRLLDLRQKDREARYRLGVIWLQQGRAADALGFLESLADEPPQAGDILSQRGRARQDVGRREDALADFDRALGLEPGNALAPLYRGNLMMEDGAFAAALENFGRLLQLAPGYDEAWFRLGALLWRMDRLDEALASFAKVLELNPGRISAAFNCGMLLLKLERYDEAYVAFERVRSLAPEHPQLLGGLISAVQGACDFARWPQLQRQAIEAVRERRVVIAPLAFLPFCDDGALRLRCSAMFLADRVPQTGAPLWAGARYDHDRIRIAYLSADFRQHATAELIAGLIEKHDRTRFEVIAVSFGRDDDSEIGFA